MNGRALALLLLLSLAPAPSRSASDKGAGVPSHPRQLTFLPGLYVPPHAKEHRVVLPRSGVPAYLAPDHELPLLRMQVHVRAGSYLQPHGREGTAEILEYLMAHGGIDGKRPLGPDALEDELSFLAGSIRVRVDRTSSQISLELLSKDLDQGLELLRGVLSSQTLDRSAFQRGRNSLAERMRKRNDSSEEIEARERERLAFGSDHFSTRLPTSASLSRVVGVEVRAFQRLWFHPQNFVVAAAGDFDQAQLMNQLDALFSDWPYKGQIGKNDAPAPIERAQPGIYLIDKPDVTQGRVSIILPGIQRDDPDYFAVQVLNQIIGGAGKASRVSTRLRSDEGVAYQVVSRFPGGIFYPDFFLLQFQSRLRSCSYAVSLALQELARLEKGGVSERELQVAKGHLIEGLQQRFRSPYQSMGVLAQEEITGRYPRDPDYYQNLQKRLEQVSKKDVDRAARRWLDLRQAVILVVGDKEELLKPDPRHPVQFAALGHGAVKELPLRDPLSLQPLPVKPPRPVHRSKPAAEASMEGGDAE